MSEEIKQGESVESVPVAAFREFCKGIHPSTIQAQATSLYLGLKSLNAKYNLSKDKPHNDDSIQSQIAQLEVERYRARSESGYMKGEASAREAYRAFFSGMLHDVTDNHQVLNPIAKEYEVAELANRIFEKRLEEVK
ncbi:MAG TPA: hypothetical protein VJH96_01265 [Patescibacteria group bacterium]|nr:hypothetical protein [Patescibacteria group bacterium]